MTLVLLKSAGGTVALPASGAVLVDRESGGHLIVNPPSPVWDRTELAPEDLYAWSALIAAAAHAMLVALPQLENGCINYWDAGNWALNICAPPLGRKVGKLHRSLHMHLLGRSQQVQSGDFTFGEAPRFPRYAEREAWSRKLAPLNEAECERLTRICRSRLQERYGFSAATDS